MTKKSAFVLALGMMAAILSAAVAMSLNFGIGDTAQSAPLVQTHAKKAEHHRKPIVKTRHITIKREKKAPSGGQITVVRSAPSGGSPSTQSGSSSSGGYESEHETEHEDHEGGGGGDD